MSQTISLRDAERRAFTSGYQDGLWDILIGCFLLQFAIAPFLSRSLGDLWSSVVFLPFYAVVYLGIWLVRKHVVTPRVGVVRFGSWRRTRMIRVNLVMFAVLLVALILGLLSAVNVTASPGWMHTARFSLILLVCFSVSAYFLDFTRLYAYGILIALSPLVGEWLYVSVKAAHHGFPVTFGFTALTTILTGLVQLMRLLRDHPFPAEEPPSEGIDRV